jgi:hypothetical protein
MACAIETLLDLENMTIEDLTGRLKVVEERNDVDNNTGSGGQLLLTELEWLARLQASAKRSVKLNEILFRFTCIKVQPTLMGPSRRRAHLVSTNPSTWACGGG